MKGMKGVSEERVQEEQERRMREWRVEQETEPEREKRPAQMLRLSERFVGMKWQKVERRMEKEKKADGCPPGQKVARVVLSTVAPAHRRCCRRRRFEK